MLDFLGAQAFRVLCVAVKLGVFEALGGGPLTAAEVAGRIGADGRGTALLLDTLEVLGYMRKARGRYANTPITAKWLLRSSPSSLAEGIPFFEDMVFDRWGHLDESIRRGRPAIYGYEWLEQHPGRWRSYQQGMIAVARAAADEIVAKVRLPSGARRLIDIGGGHGLYSIKFCHRYPGLSATVFDLPQALEVGRETIAAEGMGDRVSIREGDFWRDGLGAGYDVALLFNIIHAHSPDKNADLLCKVSGAVNPGGLVAVLDQLPGRVSGQAAKALARLQGLNYFNDLDARTYDFDQIAGWMAKAGIGRPRRILLRRMPGFGVVLGIRTAAGLANTWGGGP